MSQPLDYPDAPTGPQTAVLPEGHYQQSSQGYGYPPGPGPQQTPPSKPSRLNIFCNRCPSISGILLPLGGMR